MKKSSWCIYLIKQSVKLREKVAESNIASRFCRKFNRFFYSMSFNLQLNTKKEYMETPKEGFFH